MNMRGEAMPESEPGSMNQAAGSDGRHEGPK